MKNKLPVVADADVNRFVDMVRRDVDFSKVSPLAKDKAAEIAHRIVLDACRIEGLSDEYAEALATKIRQRMRWAS